MSFFYPNHSFHRIWEITPEWLTQQGISVLLLDVDNTLTTHDNPVVPKEVTAWMEEMHAAGVRLLLLSNNRPERVEPFAELLGLGWIARAAKPLPSGVNRALLRLGVQKSGIAVVGDQVFTDVLCAKTAGVVSILVEPMELEVFPFFKVKRGLERVLLKNYQRGGRR